MFSLAAELYKKPLDTERKTFSLQVPQKVLEKRFLKQKPVY